MRRIDVFPVLWVLVFGAACDASAQTTRERLHTLLADEWDYTMVESPEYATAVGYPGQNRRWTDGSMETIRRRQAHQVELLEKVKRIDRAGLSAADKLNYDLYLRRAELDIEGHAFKDEYMPVNQMGGVQQNLASTISRMPTRYWKTERCRWMCSTR